MDSVAPDDVSPSADQHLVQDLPVDAPVFLLGSRYCETDHLSQATWDLFDRFPPGRVILLHGGPDFSEMRLFRRYNGPLERSFTVVYWDQRGAGKSFNPNIPKSLMRSSSSLPTWMSW